MISLIEEKLDKILLENGLYDTDENVQTQLLSEMNSLLFIELVVSIETTFDVGIPDEYLLLAHFRSRNNIIRIIQESVRRNIES